MHDHEFYLLLLNLLIAIAALLFIRHRYHRNTIAPENRKLPRCAKCRYALVNMTSNICPECGSDIPTRGVIPPGNSGTPTILQFILWTILCVGVATLLITQIRWTVRKDTDHLFIESAFSSPHAVTSFYSKISVEGTLTSLSNDRPDIPVDFATLEFILNGKSVTIEAIPNPTRYRFAGTLDWHPFDAAKVFSECQARGIDATNSDNATLTKVNISYLKQAAEFPFTSNLNKIPFMHAAVSFETVPLVTPLIVFSFLMLVVWTWGMLKFLPRFTKILRGDKALALIRPVSYPAFP